MCYTDQHTPSAMADSSESKSSDIAIRDLPPSIRRDVAPSEFERICVLGTGRTSTYVVMLLWRFEP